MKLEREAHLRFIKELDRTRDYDYWTTLHLRLSAIYWATVSYKLLGNEEVLPRETVIDYILQCQQPVKEVCIKSNFHMPKVNGNVDEAQPTWPHGDSWTSNRRDQKQDFTDKSSNANLNKISETTSNLSNAPMIGFGAHIGHDAHLINTVYAIQVLAMHDALDKIDQDKVAKYVASLQCGATGGWFGDEWGESDLRFVYGALNCLSILKRLHYVDINSAMRYVLKCQNFDGGFGPKPGAESHAAYVFTAVGALAISGHLDKVNQGKIAAWLSDRQTPNGGLNGRPGKLPDVCYSWWECSPLAVLGKLEFIDKNALIDFILSTQDPERGGFADRPEDATDIFHTCFALAALSLLGYPDIEPIDKMYCLPLETTKRLGLS